MKSSNTANKWAPLGLFVATVAWGSSFFLVKGATALVGVWPYLFWRFATASALLIILFPRKFLSSRRVILLSGFVGFAVFATLVAQTIGLQKTSASRSGFLTALYVPGTPVLAWLLLKQRIHLRQFFIVAIALAGLFFLTQSGEFEGLVPWWQKMNEGDLWVILGAFFASIHIVITERLARTIPDSIALGLWQFVWCAIFSLLFLTVPSPHWNVLAWPHFAHFSLLITVIFSTCFGFIMQIFAQKTVGSLKAALIFALEAPLSTAFAYFFAGEIMTSREVFGASLVFLTSIIPERWLKKQ